MLENLLLLPFRLAWNIVLVAIVIGLFCLWWPFLFGSVVGVVLVLIFAPSLFIWPILLFAAASPIWPD